MLLLMIVGSLEAVNNVFDGAKNANGGMKPQISSEGTNKLLVEELVDSCH